MEKKITTSQIVSRDVWRIKNYKDSLRGYQVRKDILENIFHGLDLNKIKNKRNLIIADVGCGPGICGEYILNAITKHVNKDLNIQVFFIDISQAMLDQIPDKKNYKKIKGDVTNIPLADNSVDIIIMKQVLDYLPRELQIKALSEINRILKKDGEFILSALVSPSIEINKLVNKLYSEREKIIAEKVAIDKFIPDENTLFKWLEDAGFFANRVFYAYDIPLSVNDFKKSFNLDEEKQNKLKRFYREIISLDKSDYFKSEFIDEDVELTEKGIIIRGVKAKV